ncbi:DUF2681 domain-containing protein [Escherichia phage BUCT618]|nr:DUF2681 domain-containing protein [Escherichia phage BUCT618]
MITLSTIIGAITALIIGAVGLWLGGKSRGKSEQKSKSYIQQAQQALAQEKARTESVKVANDVKDEVLRSNPGSVRDKLRDEWTRPGN